MSILDKILRAGEGRTRRNLERLTAVVNSFEEDFAALDDTELAAMTVEFRRRHADGETLDQLLPEAFAVVREASKRVLGMRHFDVQIMGGAALHQGNIAEMRTGEGKTLVSTLPAYLNALPGDGVHVVTVNDYLATRDAEHMGKVHNFLGLSVGVITSDLSSEQRRAAYACDITYGTNNELGFDYLRDNMATSPEDLVQRGHNFAVVDEVDSILIDEARTPLIISGPGEDVTAWYYEFARIAARLTRDVDYDVDEKKRTIGLREAGVSKVEDWLGAGNLYESEHTPLVGYLNMAVRAKELYKVDKDYVVIDGEVLIVDEHTGRVLAGRRYSDGLHQALEAKEGVSVEAENQTLSTITLQNYFRLYKRLSGMTGTATSEAAEFHQIYDLGVVPIPTNKTSLRLDTSDIIYRTEEAKFAAVVVDIAARHEAGQPVLVGTTSVEKSEKLSALLAEAGVPHAVLNAKQHEREAHIVAQAGRHGAVTVATNMAGRGTDIVLGGNVDELAAAAIAARELAADEPEDVWEAAWLAASADAKEAAAQERAQVVAAGGLYVLGTERHESRRIDNQLRGRSGRQGDPGETRFYLSLEDELMRRFAGAMLTRAMDALGAGDVPIQSNMVNRSVASAQTSMESRNYESRKDVLKYDDVLNKQREVLYAERRRVLEGHDVSGEIKKMTAEVITGLVSQLTGFSEDWDLDKLLTDVRLFVPVTLTADDLIDEAGGDHTTLDHKSVTRVLLEQADKAYEAREAELGEERLHDLERRVLLTVVDRRWREHLHEMDYMREGIHMRSMAQRDPLVEYQRESYDMFLALLAAIKEETVGYVFHVAVPAPRPTLALDGLELDYSFDEDDNAVDAEQEQTPVTDAAAADEPGEDIVEVSEDGSGTSGVGSRGVVL